MSYYLSKQLNGITFENAKARVIEALQSQGFGVLTEIDIKATMKKKLDKDYLPHIILGACNPVYADKVLQHDPHISTMLPCNVTLRETETGSIEVSAIDPVAAMSPVQNQQIEPLANDIRQKLTNVLEMI